MEYREVELPLTHTTLDTEPSRPDNERTPPLALHWVFPETISPYPLTKSPVDIGRAIDADICLAGAAVSRLHAQLYRQGPLWVLRDCDSRNGTFVDGIKITHEPLRIGSVIRMGSHVAVVERNWGQDWTPRWVGPHLFAGVALRTAIESALLGAKSKLPIAVIGETGTGKEGVARAIHHESKRTGPFIGVNCAAIPEAMASAELFGHTKGAFTGASSANAGYLRAASGGTLFLDEVVELPLSQQAKLLRALQEQEVTPVGSSQAVPVDLRLVCAAQQPLEAYVERGTLRADLVMRLAGITVVLPPLRERRLEIAALFQHFVRNASGGGDVPEYDAKLIESLCISHWLGNVRQLEMTARRLVAITEPGQPLRLTTKDTTKPSDELEAVFDLEDDRPAIDRKRLLMALKQTQGNLTAACKLCRISRQRAYRLLQPSELTGRNDVSNVG